VDKFSSIDLGPRQQKEVVKVLRGLAWESKGYVQKTNRLENGELVESECVLVDVFGKTSEAYEKEYIRLYSKFEGKITKATLPEFLAEAAKSLEVIKKWRRVEDRRKTKDELEQQQAAAAVRIEEQRKKDEEFNRQSVEIETGKMGIMLVECFDDSDMMTDYYSPHRPISERLLAIVKNQAQKESLARRVINQIPDLKAIEFEWKTETYSMGHGNYMEAKTSHRTSKEKAYRFAYGAHADDVAVFYEIQFNKGYPSRAIPHPDYYLGDLTEINTKEIDKANGKTVQKNTEKQGVEILFDQRPSDQILTKLKANGWRWSRFNRVWYNRLTPENLEFAKAL
jgi:hypothetical protein